MREEAAAHTRHWSHASQIGSSAVAQHWLQGRSAVQAFLRCFPRCQRYSGHSKCVEIGEVDGNAAVAAFVQRNRGLWLVSKAYSSKPMKACLSMSMLWVIPNSFKIDVPTVRESDIDAPSGLVCLRCLWTHAALSVNVSPVEETTFSGNYYSRPSLPSTVQRQISHANKQA